MTVGIMQPYFLPYIGYFQLIQAVDVYVIYDDAQYIKGGWINRNNILVNGQKFMFNLLMHGASSNKKINEVQVDANQTKLIKTIENSYRKAPYFDAVSKLLDNIFFNNEKNLAVFIATSISEVCLYLNIDTKFVFSSELNKNNELFGQDKVINMCEILGATNYINAIGGQELYCKEEFNNKSIDLKFIDTIISPYAQSVNEFVPYLSILDVMMYNSVDEIKVMLDNYKLI